MQKRPDRTIRRSPWAPPRGVAVVLSLAVMFSGVSGWWLQAPTAEAFERPTAASGNSLTYPSGLTVTASVTQGQTTPATTVTAGSAEFGESTYGYNAADYTPAPGSNTPGFFVTVPATEQCATYGLCANSRGSITFTFSQPVRNPRMHLVELGGYIKKGTTENNATTSLNLASPDVAMSVVSGRNLRITGGDTIETINKKVNTSCNTASQPPGCGTISFAGTVTSLTFDLSTYISNFFGPATPFAVQDRFPVSFTFDQDYGDAPASYDAGDAARSAMGDLQIGRGVTVDNANVANATTSPNASAQADGDTDDGVPAQLPDVQAQAGQIYTRTIPISGASKAGTACGWIDFNRNGTFETSERNCTTFAAGAQSAALQWTTSAGTTAGASFARFRVAYDSAQAQSPTGASSSGEVEDTRISFVGQRLNCTTGAFYGLSSAGTNKPVYSIDPTTGATIQVTSIAAASGTNNAMGLSPDGRYLWSYNPTPANKIFRTDVETGTTTSYSGTTAAAQTSGAVNPSNGIYYYGGISTTGTSPNQVYTLNVYGFNTTTNTTIGQVATGVIPNVTGGLGDFVFDVLGNLYLIAGGTNASAFLLANQKLPTTAQGTPLTLTYSKLSDIPVGSINSTAFGFDGYLYMGTSTNVIKVNPGTGVPVSNVTMTNQSNNVDFASCANPDVLIVRKNIDGHDKASDQFTLSFTGNGITQTGTTDGAADGLHTNTEELAGPLPVLAGQTFTISETGAAGATLANYASSYACENSDTNTTIASGTGTSGSVTISNGIGAVITCTFTNTPLRPAITLDKIAGSPTGTTAGSQIPYRFVVRNTGNVPLTGLALTDTKVGTVTCPTTSLTVGASTTCTARYTLTQADINSGQVVNNASVRATSSPGTTVTATDSTTSDLERDPQLTLTKTAGAPVDRNSSGITDAGDTIAYTFGVTNSGNVTITNLAISDAKVGAVTCQATTLAPGATTTCSTNTPYVITAADQSAGRVDNAARATGNPPAGLDPIQSDQATTSTPVATPNPKLNLIKTAGTPTDVNGDGLVDAGDTIAYSFRVDNTGNVPISGITVTDAKLGTVTCGVTTLAAGASTTCTAAVYTITAADQSSGGVTNSATANGTPPASNPAVPPSTSSTSTPVTTPKPAVTLAKTAGTPTDVNGDGLTDAGDTIAYTFRVANTGNVPLNAVTVTDAKLGPVTCAATSLAVGASTTCSAATYTITAADAAAGKVDNTATVNATSPGGGSATGTASTSTPTVAANPKLTLTKTAGTPADRNNSGLTDAGDTIAYSFTVTNDGNLPITGLVVNDAKIGTVTCQATTLAPSATTTCTGGPYTVTTADQTAGAVVNSATATGTARGGTAVTSNQPSTRTPVSTPDPKLTVVKTATAPVDRNNSGLTDAGDTIAYTFRVTNAGNVPIRSIAIDDAKVGAVSCPVTTLAPGASTTCATTTPYVVTTADETAGQVANSASATGTNPDGGTVTSPPSTTTTPTTKPKPQLSIDKRAAAPVDRNASGITDAGDTIAYTFVVTNTGNVPIGAVAVTDSKVSPVTCPQTTLAPGATTTCTAAPYTVKTADQTAGSVDNSATASGRDPNNAAITSSPDTTSTPVTLPNPKLSLDKQAAAPVDRNSSGLTDAGDTIAYTFTVTNVGNVPITTIAIADTKAGTITCDATTLAVGATTTCRPTAAYVVTTGDEAAGSVLNTARATGRDPDNSLVRSNDDNTTTPTTVPNPQLTVLKTAGTPVDVNSSGLTDAGDTIAYTFTVTNAGNVPISAVAVDDAKVGTVTCQATTLAVGASTTCTAAPYVITAADQTAGKVTNTATATGNDPNGVGVRSPGSSTSTPVDTPDPKLTLVKTAGTPVDVNSSGLTDAGDTIAYTFTVTNTGNVPVSAVAVDDPLVGTVTCGATTLAVGASTTCTAAPYVVTTADQTAGAVNNTAVASARNPDGGVVRSPGASTTTPVQTPDPRLEIVKSAGAPVDRNASGLTDAGDTIAYTFTVTNTGNVPISAVAVNDSKVGAVTCQAAALAVGASTTCTAAPYVVTTSDETAGAATNTATVTGRNPDGGTVTGTSNTTSTPATKPQPSLTIDKTAGTPRDVNSSGLVDAGDTIAYTFVVTNTGNVPLSLVNVRDNKAGSVTCQSTTLAVGAQTNCAANNPYVVTEADQTAGSVDNSAFATATDPDGGGLSSPPDGTSSRVDTPKPSLLVDKKAAAPVDVNRDGLTDAGDTIAYTFTVTNTGNVPIRNVTINDPKIGAVTCTPADLAVGGVATCTPNTTYVVTRFDERAGQVANTATATGRDPDDRPITSNPDSTATPVGTPAPTIALTKTAQTPVDVNSSGITDAGDTIQYVFTVTNTGNVPVNAVAITDPTAGTVTCDATTLAVGAVANCRADAVYTVTEADEAAGFVRNRATASATDNDGNPVASDPANTSTPVTTPNPKLTVDKTAGDPVDVNSSGITDAGDTIAYTFVVRNIGNVPISNVAVTDATAGPVTCTPTTLAPGASANCAANSPYVVTETDETAGSVANTATGGGTDPDGGTVTSPPDSTDTPTDRPNPALTLVKSAGTPVDVNADGITDAGDTIAYTFTVTNTGNVPVRAVAVSDPKVGTVTCTPTTLAVKAVANCTAAPYVITDADEANPFVVNTATASATDPDNDPVTSNTDSTRTAVTPPAPALTTDKIAGTPVDVNADGLVDAGDTITYTFVVANTGNVPLNTVTVTDAKVGPVTCPTAPLPVGQSVTCTAAPYAITAADVAKGSVDNSATSAAATNDGDPTSSPPDTTSTPTTTPAPSLAFDKRAAAPVDVNGSGITDAGDTIAFTFTVTNTGNVPVRAVAVTDPTAGTVTCGATTLAVGASTTCTAAPYVVTEADERAGAVTNTAYATAATNDGDPVRSPSDTTSTPTVIPDPLLRLDKSADAPVDVNADGIVDAGDTIQYRFTVRNLGNVPIDGIAVSDRKAGAVTCPLTRLTPGQSTVCTADAVYTITAADVTNSAVENTATGTGTDPDGGTVPSNPSSIVVDVDTPAPGLSLVKTAADPVDVNSSGITDAGDTIAYTFTVTNTGNVPVRAIAINDAKAGAVTCQATVLAPGATTSCAADQPYVVTAADVTAGAAINTATASGTTNDGDPVVSEPARTVTPTTSPAPRLTLDKVAGTPVDVNDDGITDAGDTIAYTFTAINSGNVPITGVTVNDSKVGTVTCTPTTLPVGSTASCTAAPYTITEADEAAGGVANTATASGRDPDGNPLTSPPDSTNTPDQAPAPSLAFDKRAAAPVDVNNSGITDAGDTIAYSFEITNTGNVPVRRPSVTDTLVGQVTCPVVVLGVGESVICTADPYVVTAADTTAGSVVNVASASAVTNDGDPVQSPTDSTTTPTVTPAPALTVDKVAEAPVDANRSGQTDAGDTIQFRFTVANTGNVPITGVVVTDALAGPVTCAATTLAVGASTTCAADRPYTITEADLRRGSVENTATAGGNDPDGNPTTSPPDSVSTPLPPVRTGLALVKTNQLQDADGDGRADAGEKVRYSFAVTNTGNVTVTGVAISDSRLAGQPISCAATTLAPRESTTCTADYTVTAADVAADPLVNTATASGCSDPASGARVANARAALVAASCGNPVTSPSASTRTPVDVPVAPEPPEPPVLPNTGGPALGIGIAGLVLLGLGLLAWRRRD